MAFATARRDGGRAPLWFKACCATALLLVVGGLAAPSTLSGGAILSMLPFFAVLSIASIGQHLVIQQRGLDLSVAGMISFAAALITTLPSSSTDGWSVIAYSLIAAAAGALAGGACGVIVDKFSVPPLITTLGANSVLLGMTLFISHGTPSKAVPSLSQFAIGKFVGVPNTVLALSVVAAVAIFVVNRTTIGRRFVAVGVNARAAYAAGISVDGYRTGTYVCAGMLYAASGILLAGYLAIPTVFCGTPYLLATVAAVVIGGNSIAGDGRGSVVATIVGAFFLSYLDQLVLAAGLDTAAQYIVEFVIVIGAVALPPAVQHVRRIAPKSPRFVTRT